MKYYKFEIITIDNKNCVLLGNDDYIVIPEKLIARLKTLFLREVVKKFTHSFRGVKRVIEGGEKQSSIGQGFKCKIYFFVFD